MATPSVHQGDHIFQGHVKLGSVDLPAGDITNTHIGAGAAIDASKLQHPIHKTYRQKSTTQAVAETYVIHVVAGAAASVVRFEAGCVSPCAGDSTISVDLHKNGSTILSAPISLSASQGAYATVVGAISSAALVAGNVLEVVVTVSAGTGTLGDGVFAELQLAESAA